MREIIVFRHSLHEDLGLGCSNWALPARLTLAGQNLARRIADLYKDLLKNCNYFVTSPLIRAQETLFAMMEELWIPVREFDKKVIIANGLWTSNPADWLSESNWTVGEVWEKSPVFVEGEGTKLWITGIMPTFRELIRLEEGKALCISHGGLLDAAVAFVRKVYLGDEEAFSKIKDFRKGEGVVFVFDDRKDILEVRELRFPDDF